MKVRTPVVAALALCCVSASVAVAAAPGAYSRPGHTTRATVAADGRQASYPKVSPGDPTNPLWTAHGASDLSTDGRYVVFASSATNLVPGVVTQAGIPQIYRRDMRTGRIDLVSASVDGTPGLRGSHVPAVSASGRFVAFFSEAPNLVPGDTNATSDVFWRDMSTGRILRVSVTPGGRQATPPPADRFAVRDPSISDDGRKVAFESRATNMAAGVSSEDPGWCCSHMNEFVHDVRSGKTELVSVGYSGKPAFGRAGSISGNGRYVAFTSGPGVVRGVDHSGEDVYVRDPKRRTTVLASVASDGSRASVNGIPCGESPAPPPPILPLLGTINTDDAECPHSQTYSQAALRGISDDGRYVTFMSTATNLVPNVPSCSDIPGEIPQVFLFCGGMYVRDRVARRTERVDVDSNGQARLRPHAASAGQPISGDGRFVAYRYEEGQRLGCGIALPRGPLPAIEVLDGVCHAGRAYVYDRLSGEMEWVTRPYKGTKLEPGMCGDSALTPDEWIDMGSLSGDGRHFSFMSPAKNIVPGDTNDHCDVFVRDRGLRLGIGALTGSRTAPAASTTKVRLNGLLDPAARGGAVLTGSRVVLRPSLRDLYVRWDVDRLTAVSGVPVGGLLYAMEFTSGSTRYQVRVQRAPGADYDTVGGASFGLFRETSAGVWARVSPLKGGYGTVGDAVVTAVPRSLLGGKARLTNVTAYTAIGSYQSGATTVLDELRLVR